jgi:lipopolysaccharide transport system ATP-binding protein
MTYIRLKNVSVDIPIFNANTRSLKKKIFQPLSSSKISQDKKGIQIVQALKNINLNLTEGDRIGIIGANGSGKSTLLRVLNGIYVPTSGEILSEGNIASLIDISLGMDSEATGVENIYIQGQLLGLSKNVIKKNIDKIINFSELNEFIELPVRTYSSGMSLRLGFSVSTMLQPEILIMDEWLSVGDENFKKKIDSRLKSILSKTKIFVLASHSKDLIMNNCNRVLWIDNGFIRLDDIPHKVCKEYFL